MWESVKCWRETSNDEGRDPEMRETFPQSRRQFLRLIGLIAGAGAAPSLARAALPKAAKLTPQDQADLRRTQEYLNDIHTLQSRFQQFSPEGGIASGTIWLERPGHMRILYDEPVGVLIVSDGWQVYYWDKKLEQLSQIAVGDTPAWFLLRPEIKLTGDVTVTRFERTPGALRIAMSESDHPDNGSLTLVMGDHPMELKQWTVIDAQQKPVSVTLVDPHFGAKISSNLFVWSDPRSNRSP